MNKGVIITIIFTMLLLIGGAFMLAKPEEKFEIPPRDTTAYEYFWGNGCPHCASVAAFLDSWDKKDSISITKYEVWYDKKNAQIMQDRFNNCQEIEDSGQMAVPFLVTPEGKCLIGDTPIIELFKSL